LEAAISFVPSLFEAMLFQNKLPAEVCFVQPPAAFAAGVAAMGNAVSKANNMANKVVRARFLFIDISAPIQSF
jgi:hypothetical protein